MKIRKNKPEENSGIIFGGILFFVVMALILKTSTLLNISNQIIVWVTVGLAALMVTIGHYTVSRKVIDEKKRTEDIMAIKGNLIGYFLWIIVLIIANLLKIEISTFAMLVGGYVTILLVLAYMNKRVIKEQK
ncbi:hypothetical protein MSBRW_0561 [Methanosarcina barkeri str. Wiesmoor]|uniref:DUF2178 domain-containing protein n=2 Tax=Methanosarcina barkeri TaxID=2208 RepID=A0A0E3QGX3_METBA|nr:hypothetical protein [Methanosarcina barkeri]AKB49814.1 hypothetical protein MSBRW_0561 [Methanosarcina barkeri str. Wiesmoor]